MTPKEFKAWFDGFTEAFTGTPTKAQWSRIKERVSEIDGAPITERVFVNRWWYPYYSTYNRHLNTIPNYPFWTVYGASGTASGNNYQGIAQSQIASQFDSILAMNELGKLEGKI